MKSSFERGIRDLKPEKGNMTKLNIQSLNKQISANGFNEIENNIWKYFHSLDWFSISTQGKVLVKC